MALDMFSDTLLDYMKSLRNTQGSDGMPGLDEPFSIIIAANNEEGYIEPCLAALLGQGSQAGVLDVVVSANACTDRTVAQVRALISVFEAAGHKLRCVERAEPGKVDALNAGDAKAAGPCRAYLDADVICDPALIGQLRVALAPDRPLYATGTLVVARAKNPLTQAYVRFWQRLPFVQSGAVGAGLFAVNEAGRARWGTFPDIISDDTFVRLNFSPTERVEVPAPYHWPMVEGWSGLVRVRRRQDAGVREIYQLYPQTIKNEAKGSLSAADLLRLGLRDPVGFAVYVGVHIAVRCRSADGGWARGR